MQIDHCRFDDSIENDVFRCLALHFAKQTFDRMNEINWRVVIAQFQNNY